ncbi:hypothetical protein Hte_008424 [Hypoxylon texense]
MGIIESKLLGLRIRLKPKRYGSTLVPVNDYYGDHFGLIDSYLDETYEDACAPRRMSSLSSCYDEGGGDDGSDGEMAAPRPIYTSTLGPGRISTST